MKSDRNILLEALTFVWLPVLIVAGWWVISANSQNFYFPPLAEVFVRMKNEALRGHLWDNILYSMVNYTVGYAIAAVLAVLLGVVLGANRAVRTALGPLLDFMRAMPQIALVPVVIMALGIGAAPKMFLIGFIVFWPILLNTIDGVRGLNPQLLEVGRAYRIPYLLYLRRVILPGATPSIMAGMRISLGLGVVMMVVSEMYSSTSGIGFYILQSQESYRITSVWAGTIVIGLLGYIISVGFLVVERQVLAWYLQREPLIGRRAGSGRAQSPGSSLVTPSTTPDSSAATAHEGADHDRR